MNTQIAISDTEKRQALLKRFSELKPRLPKNWRKQFCTKYPQFDNKAWYFRLNNLYNLKGTDEAVTKLLESMFPVNPVSDAK